MSLQSGNFYKTIQSVQSNITTLQSSGSTIRSDISGVILKFQDLSGQVQVIDASQVEMALEMDVMDASMLEMVVRMDAMDISMNANEERLDALDVSMSSLETGKQDVITNLSSDGFLSAGSNITFDVVGSNVTINSSGGGGGSDASMNEVFANVADLSDQLIQLIDLYEYSNFWTAELRLTNIPVSRPEKITLPVGTYLMFAQLTLTTPSPTFFNDATNDIIRSIFFRFQGPGSNAGVEFSLPVARTATTRTFQMNMSGQYFHSDDSEWNALFTANASSTNQPVNLNITIDRLNLLRISKIPYSFL